MPPGTLFATASAGTVILGITYKLRKGEPLKPAEWLVLCIALAIWGVIAFAGLLVCFPEADHGLPSSFLAIPLGVGLSEIFVFIVAAGVRLVEMIPEAVRAMLRWRFGGDK